MRVAGRGRGLASAQQRSASRSHCRCSRIRRCLHRCGQSAPQVARPACSTCCGDAPFDDESAAAVDRCRRRRYRTQQRSQRAQPARVEQAWCAVGAYTGPCASGRLRTAPSRAARSAHTSVGCACSPPPHLAAIDVPLFFRMPLLLYGSQLVYFRSTLIARRGGGCEKRLCFGKVCVLARGGG